MAKKKAVKKAKQLPLVEKAAKPKKSSVKFVSLTVTAVIPTQQYGNIQPKIEVQADNYADARAFVMPLIEELYAQYTETKPGFLGRIQVTEKVVGQVMPITPAAEKKLAQTSTTPQAGHVADATATASAAPAKPKSEFVLKAEKMLSLAATEDAAIRIQDQIEKSTKIAEEDKPELLKQCLVRRGELSKAK